VALSQLFGLLNINKPPGWSSRDAVNVVQKLVKPAKVGHAGTLDPLATGVLVVAIGQATRLVEYVQQQSKDYCGTFLLGRSSDTEDSEGQVVELNQPPIPTREQIEACLPRFLGEIEQVPPAFSALKVAGQRAYQRARRGEEVKLESRRITIHALSLVHYAYPTLQLQITCGSGTYIRSLGRDLARALGTEAIMSALVRTRIGAFSVETALAPQQLTRAMVEQHLQPASLAVSQLTPVVLTENEVQQILWGRSLPREEPSASLELAGVDSTGRLIAILTTTGGQLRPLRVFPRD
jgi:tRNA pseudouridine55 synthase